jgi:hypothetical protein
MIIPRRGHGFQSIHPAARSAMKGFIVLVVYQMQRKIIIQEEEPAEKVQVNTVEDMWRVNIEAIYRKKNPKKLDNVPALMAKYIHILCSQCQKLKRQENDNYDSNWQAYYKFVK